jgi:hypothetical protein
MLPALLLVAARLGYMVGNASKPAINIPDARPRSVLSGHLDDLPLIPSA